MKIGNRTQSAGYRTRNVLVADRRTSIRLEDSYWDALKEIMGREDITLHALVTRIHSAQPIAINLSGSVRVFILSYFRALASQQTPVLPPEFNWLSIDQEGLSER